MALFDIKLTDDSRAIIKSNPIKFATKLVARACDFSNETIDIKVDDGDWVDLKSIMGVLTVNYARGNTISFRIKGTFEDECAMELQVLTNQLLS